MADSHNSYGWEYKVIVNGVVSLVEEAFCHAAFDDLAIAQYLSMGQGEQVKIKQFCARTHAHTNDLHIHIHTHIDSLVHPDELDIFRVTNLGSSQTCSANNQWLRSRRHTAAMPFLES